MRPVARVVRAREMMEGAGVLVRRTVGTPLLPNLDPFLMLDHLSSSVAAAAKGFPTHPHKGQTTVSIMLRGGMEHTDSMGNKGVVSDGGVQIMRAGNGVLHSERPTAPSSSSAAARGDGDEGSEIEGFQLWVNLPAELKRAPPAYQDVEAGAIPTAALPGVGGNGGGRGATARVIAGRLPSSSSSSTPFVEGPARIAPPSVLLLDVTVPPGGTACVPVDDAFAGFAYIYASGPGATLGGVAAPARHALVLSEPPPTKGQQQKAAGPGSSSSPASVSFSDVEARAGVEGGALKFLLVAGCPISEPIVQRGPFVMNTRAEVERAFRDYSEGTLVQQHGEGRFDPFAAGNGAAGARDEFREEGRHRQK